MFEFARASAGTIHHMPLDIWQFMKLYDFRQSTTSIGAAAPHGRG
jgi:hypothetical protein